MHRLWSYCADLGWILKQELGIYSGAMPADAEEQMWSCETARRADYPYRAALFNLLTRLNLYRCEVETHSDKAIAVIDEYSIAREKQVLGNNYSSFGDR